VRLQLLNAEDIGPLPGEPAEEPAALGAAQTVRVESDDAQQKAGRLESEAI
jgi:hypothetical protein